MADDAAAPDGELTDSTATDPTKTEATESDASTAIDVDGVDDDEDDDIDDVAAIAPRSPMSHVRLATIAGLGLVVALAALTGWLGYRTYESHKADAERKLFLQVGRQGALNLTTIDWQQADADVQRILDSATGTFYDDFQKRAQPFIEIVKQAQSKSTGTIAEAGLETASDDEAQVLVAVTVKTTNAGAPDQQPRAWRMRISVEKVGDEAKVSNVEFVP
ncbi:Mce protein [Mycobacterium sp. URHB0021]|jgi:Mce-associated membrane protein